MIKTFGKRLVLAFLAIALVALVAGCGSNQPADDGTVHTGEMKVEMKAIKYVPANFTVKVGTKITFLNRDAMTHDVVQLDIKNVDNGEAGFDSGVIDPGKSWSITLDKPGVYPILCTQSAHFTTGMVGTITVVE